MTITRSWRFSKMRLQDFRCAAFALLVAIVLLAAGGLAIAACPSSHSLDPHSGVSPAISASTPVRTATNASGTAKIGLAGLIDVGFGTEGVAYDPENGYVYAPTSATSPFEVGVVLGMNVVATLYTAQTGMNSLEGPWFDDTTGYAYVAAEQPNSGSLVSVIDGASIVANITIGVGPNVGVYDSADGYLYVANAGSGNVTVIHGAAAIASIAVGPSPSSEEYDPASDFLYVSNTNTVSVIRGTAVVATLYVGAAPGTPLWDGQNGYVYVPNANSDNVSVINGTTVITSIVVGVNPQPALYDATNGYVYVANEDGIVSAIQGTTLVATIPVSNPSYGWALGMDYDRGSGYLYLPDLYNGSLVIINGTQIVSRVSLPQPYADYALATYDVENGYVYVSSAHPAPYELNSNVSVVDGTTLLANVIVPGVEAGEPECDANNGLVYVSNAFSKFVSVISGTMIPTYSVAFKESGLPIGTNWSVLLNGTTEFSAEPSMTVIEPNGTYAYTAVALGYTPIPGSLTVAGSSPPPTAIDFGASGGTGAPVWVFAASIAFAGAVIAALVVTLQRRRRPPGPSTVRSSPSGNAPPGVP
ncbi:MAG: YncE family protein [Thermoplasmata archaeon]